jgi:hypothetical protein
MIDGAALRLCRSRNDAPAYVKIDGTASHRENAETRAVQCAAAMI